MLRDFLAQHTDVFRLGLVEDYVKTPDYFVQVFDAFGRTTRDEAQGAAIAITALLGVGSAYFYEGLDLRPTIEKNEEVVTYYSRWHYMQEEVGMAETSIKKNLGMTIDDFMGNRPPNKIDASSPKTILNIFSTAYKAAALGVQERRIEAIYGTDAANSPNDISRAPESIDDLFNADGNWHGIGPDALGDWRAIHPWYDNPPGVFGLDNAAKTAALPNARQRHRPQIVDLGRGDGDYDAPYNTADNRRLSWKLLNRIMGPYQEVVQTPCLAAVPSEDFYILTEDIARNNRDAVPQGVMRGGMGEFMAWCFDVQAIKIRNTWFFPSHRMPEQTIRVFNVGDVGEQNGTVYPLYSSWNAPSEGFGEIVRASLNDLPQAISRFAPIQLPWKTTEFRRSERHAAALQAEIQLDWTMVCDNRAYQMEIRRYGSPAGAP